MKFNEEASNPMLVGAMQLLKAEDTPEHRQLFTQEVAKAVFLSPVYVEPEPTISEDGKTVVAPGAKVQFPMLNTKDGKKFFVLYTDKRCLEQAVDVEGNATPEIFRKHFAALALDEIGAMLATPGPGGEMNPAAGAIINPFNENLVIGKEMAIGLFEHKVEVFKNKAQQMMKNRQDAANVVPFPGRKED